MSFYLKPPRGDIFMEKLEDLALKRWKFLNILKDNVDSVEEFHEKLADHGNLSESVMEHSSKDRVSHFILRLVISKSKYDYDLRRKWIQCETLLFSYRLREMFDEDIEKSLKEVIRHLSAFEVNEENDDDLSVIQQALVTILENQMLGQNSQNNPGSFKVAFHLVPNLVSKRLVNLELGQAIITSSKVMEFVQEIFSKLLKSSIMQMSKQDLSYGAEEDDQRLVILIKRIRNQISDRTFQRDLYCVNDIKAEEVDSMSKDFPMCFQRVHENLKSHHRLGHHARVAYTLFLKEIGLPLDQALKFWSQHYSKHSKNTEKCSHSWQENHKKFEYSINHLYGNAGGAKNYSAHGCESISQRNSSIREELTCPFHEPDIEDLGNVLEAQRVFREKTQVTNILQSLNNGARQACSTYLVERYGKFKNENVEINKPSQYVRLVLS